MGEPVGLILGKLDTASIIRWDKYVRRLSVIRSLREDVDGYVLTDFHREGSYHCVTVICFDDTRHTFRFLLRQPHWHASLNFYNRTDYYKKRYVLGYDDGLYLYDDDQGVRFVPMPDAYRTTTHTTEVHFIRDSDIILWQVSQTADAPNGCAFMLDWNDAENVCTFNSSGWIDHQDVIRYFQPIPDLPDIAEIDDHLAYRSVGGFHDRGNPQARGPFLLLRSPRTMPGETLLLSYSLENRVVVVTPVSRLEERRPASSSGEPMPDWARFHWKFTACGTRIMSCAQFFEDTRLVLEMCLFDPVTQQRTLTIVPLREDAFSHVGYTDTFEGENLEDVYYLKQSDRELIIPRIGHVRYERGEVSMLVLKYDWLFPYGYSPSNLMQSVAVFKMQLEGEGPSAFAPSWGKVLLARNIKYDWLPGVMPKPCPDPDNPEQFDQSWDPETHGPEFENKSVVHNFENMFLGRHTIFADFFVDDSSQFFVPFSFRFNIHFVQALDTFHRAVDDISMFVGGYMNV